MKIVLASGNRNKYREMKDAFAPIGIELLFGGDLDIHTEVDETGSSYEENALLKAMAWSKAVGLPAIADDSGLEVTALGGAPGYILPVLFPALTVTGQTGSFRKWKA